MIYGYTIVFKKFNRLSLKLGELGDYNSEEHADGYVSEYRFVPNQVLMCV